MNYIHTLALYTFFTLGHEVCDQLFLLYIPRVSLCIFGVWILEFCYNEHSGDWVLARVLGCLSIVNITLGLDAYRNETRFLIQRLFLCGAL